uniref:Osteomodulin n=1 Tax=Cyprinus carpio TaxID=7962 RepID=A0A8C1ZNW4_CYPCA
MTPTHILTPPSLHLLSGVLVLSQDYEVDYLDFDTDDSSPEVPQLSVPQQPDYDALLVYSYECASEHIRHLYIQHNDVEEITSKPFINATSLREINLNIPSPLPKTLKRFHLSFNKISKIPADATRELTVAGIKGKILSGMKSLMQINMCNNKLKSMPTDLPESIQQISLENNSIASIPEGYFKKTPNLLSLRMPHNKLKSVAYSAFNLSKLMELHLGHNQLSKPFFCRTKLKDLNISLMCPSLDLGNPNMLTYIRLDNNKLRGPVDYYAYRYCFVLHSVTFLSINTI